MLLSGGIDSATCLFLLKKRGFRCRALTFSYQGIAKGELRAASKLALSAGVLEHRLFRLPDLKEAADIAGASFPGLPPTYIPMRNAVFYGVAAGYAEQTRADRIVGGHNKDDERVFADTGKEFFDALQRGFLAASPILREKGTTIDRPLRTKTKPEVIRLACRVGVPLELTWSCHRDGRTHCWKCTGCLGRRAGFEAAGVRDPLLRL